MCVGKRVLFGTNFLRPHSVDNQSGRVNAVTRLPPWSHDYQVG